MKIFSYQNDAGFVKSLRRRAVPEASVQETVAGIIAEVAARGDAAVAEFTRKFDGFALTPEDLFVTASELLDAERAVSRETRHAIEASLENIREFARRSLRSDWSYRNAQGVVVGERFTPFERVGVYVPGGKAPLVSTALMTAGFAIAAGVPEILAATPASATGAVNPALLFALKQAGATEIMRVGGAQAIAAMALGTEMVRPVDRIFGPGNRFVVEAKRQLVGAVSIDLLPGPSEILVVADHTGNARCIAADLLAQAEHGGDSVVGFISTSMELIEAVAVEIGVQLASLSRGEIIGKVLADGAFALHVPDVATAVRLCNDFAPEHVSLIVEDEAHWLAEVRTAGAIYVGNDSPVALGDFLAGPSHTLPTGGSGRSFSGVRADQFQRRTSIVKADRAAVAESLASIEAFAAVEGLDAHGRSVAIRLEI